jgi:hypothetical protein
MQKKICSQAMIGALAGAVILLIIGEKAIGKGLVLGTLFSIINFVLMGFFLSSQMSPSRRRASAAALGSILFRFALLAIPLVVSMKLESINILGVAIGIFMVQLTILFDQVVGKQLTTTRNT